MLPGILIQGAIELGRELIEDKDKKTEIAFKTMEKMLDSNTYRWVDALVKLSYASEQIIKGLVRPVFAAGAFIYGLTNPDVLAQLHELGAVGDMGIAAIFGAAPAWGYSRHKEKQVKQKPVSNDEWPEV